jgi:RimJ/RimL family protein N-acetyltransferase
MKWFIGPICEHAGNCVAFVYKEQTMPTFDEPPPVFLAGQSVFLRPIELADAPLCQRWINDPQIRTFVANTRPWSDLAERKYLESLVDAHDQVSLIVVLRESNRPIGLIGLRLINWTDRRADMGILIGEADSRGKGFGSEATTLLLRHAFETLNLHRVQLDVYEYNLAAVRCYERIGFIREGVLREHHFQGDKYHNVIRFGILAREFAQRYPPGRPDQPRTETPR